MLDAVAGPTRSDLPTRGGWILARSDVDDKRPNAASMPMALPGIALRILERTWSLECIYGDVAREGLALTPAPLPPGEGALRARDSPSPYPPFRCAPGTMVSLREREQMELARIHGDVGREGLALTPALPLRGRDQMELARTHGDVGREGLALTPALPLRGRERTYPLCWREPLRGASRRGRGEGELNWAGLLPSSSLEPAVGLRRETQTLRVELGADPMGTMAETARRGGNPNPFSKGKRV